MGFRTAKIVLFFELTKRNCPKGAIMGQKDFAMSPGFCIFANKKDMPFYNKFFSIAAAILLASCSGGGSRGSDEAPGLETGDLIFVSDTSGMGSAVMAATGRFSHVAIVEHTDSGLYVWEAVPGKGVICSRLADFLADQGCDSATLMSPSEEGLLRLMRPAAEYDTARLRALLHEHLGQPYDDYFMPDNGRTYCSELAEECFCNSDGGRIFATEPMNFRDAEGRMPEYWTRWFDSLGTAIPEGTPGTNPNSIFSQCREVGF